jgi:DNA repair exonuclease SbcCD nuclease subunit
VAGDIYDGADRSLRAQLAFADGIRRLDAAGIRSFICYGNHDPLDGWQARLDLPSSCHRFGPTVEAAPFDPAQPELATVLGISYPRRDVFENLVPRFANVPRRGYAIGLLHCNVGNNTEHAAYSPCTLADLAGSGIDYWALGHVHTRQVLSEHAPAVVYPGNTQGRHANERGPRGAFLVEVDDVGRATLDFRETSAVRWEAITVDIAGFEAEQQLLDAADRAIGDALALTDGRDLVFRLTVTGQGPMHDAIRRPGFVRDVLGYLEGGWANRSPFAWCERVDVATKAPFDRQDRAQAADFTGDLLRLFDEAQGDPELLGRLAGELQPLHGHQRASAVVGRELPSAEAIRSLLPDAEAACIEALHS